MAVWPPTEPCDLYQGQEGTPKLEGASLSCRLIWRVIGRESSSSVPPEIMARTHACPEQHGHAPDIDFHFFYWALRSHALPRTTGGSRTNCSSRLARKRNRRTPGYSVYALTPYSPCVPWLYSRTSRLTPPECRIWVSALLLSLVLVPNGPRMP